MTDDDLQKSQADARTFVALGLILLLSTIFLGLVAVVLPNILGIVVVVGGAAWFGLFHYIVWGWWLGDYLSQREVDSSENHNPDK
ncbi:MAG: hypothetical protein FJ267_03855 [Planctomycetes bacterium]|nr:hypothetical protein [Planctomycetota bacterium]